MSRTTSGSVPNKKCTNSHYGQMTHHHPVPLEDGSVLARAPGKIQITQDTNNNRQPTQYQFTGLIHEPAIDEQ